MSSARFSCTYICGGFVYVAKSLLVPVGTLFRLGGHSMGRRRFYVDDVDRVWVRLVWIGFYRDDVRSAEHRFARPTS